jgi:tetratricopeptide (TPR) repeat protein
MIHLFLWLCLSLPGQSTTPEIPPEAMTLVQSGIDAENRHDLDGAIVAFRKASGLAPSSGLVFLRLGNAYIKKRDYAAAIPPLKRAAELNPDSPPVHQLLGFALLTEGYAAEAIPHLEFIHEYGGLGIAQLQTGQATEAVANLQKALSKSPNDPDLLYYLSRAGTLLSSQSLDKLLATFPDSARGHQALGQHFFEMKMYPESAKEYEKALTQRPDLPGLRLELGQVYMASSDWDKAEAEFRGETALQPGNSEAAYRLGEALLQLGKMKEAAAELQRSDAMRPDMSETLFALGRAEAVSNPKEAVQSLKRVIELEKDLPLAGQANLVLAGIHRKQGNAQQAAEEMQEFHRIEALTKSRLSPPQ